MQEFFRRYWIVIPLLVVAFLVGRFLTTPEIREIVKTEYKTVTVVKTVTVRKEAKTRAVYRDRVVTPDGTVTEHEVEREETKVAEKVNADTNVQAEGNSYTEKSPARPDWHVSIMGGAQLSLTPFRADYVLGAAIERRIIGPFGLGVFVLAAPVAGNLTAGLSVGASW